MSKLKLEPPKTKRKDKEEVPKKKIAIAIFLIVFAFSGSFLIYFILQVSLNTQTPMVVVISGSMEPNIHKGDLLFLGGIEPEEIKSGTIEDKEGDVIVYDARGLWDGAPDEPIVHRVIDKWENESGYYFLTKGDANSSPDKSPVPEDRIIGVVVGRIPYIGWVKIFLTDTGLFIPLMVILAVPLIISIIWDVVKEDLEEDKKKIEKEEDKIFVKKAEKK